MRLVWLLCYCCLNCRLALQSYGVGFHLWNSTGFCLFELPNSSNFFKIPSLAESPVGMQTGNFGKCISILQLSFHLWHPAHAVRWCIGRYQEKNGCVYKSTDMKTTQYIIRSNASTHPNVSKQLRILFFLQPLPYFLPILHVIRAAVRSCLEIIDKKKRKLKTLHLEG